MVKQEQTTTQTYALEVYEAIRQFTAYYVQYSVGLQQLKETGKKVDEENLPQIEQAINQLRTYEKHAFIRLQAITTIQDIDLEPVKEQRQILSQRVPSDQELENLAVIYNRILATKFTDNLLKTPSSQVGELTGSL